jgi:hypothetical protein
MAQESHTDTNGLRSTSWQPLELQPRHDMIVSDEDALAIAGMRVGLAVAQATTDETVLFTVTRTTNCNIVVYHATPDVGNDRESTAAATVGAHWVMCAGCEPMAALTDACFNAARRRDGSAKWASDATLAQAASKLPLHQVGIESLTFIESRVLYGVHQRGAAVSLRCLPNLQLRVEDGVMLVTTPPPYKEETLRLRAVHACCSTGMVPVVTRLLLLCEPWGNYAAPLSVAQVIWVDVAPR